MPGWCDCAWNAQECHVQRRSRQLTRIGPVRSTGKNASSRVPILTIKNIPLDMPGWCEAAWKAQVSRESRSTGAVDENWPSAKHW